MSHTQSRAVGLIRGRENSHLNFNMRSLYWSAAVVILAIVLCFGSGIAQAAEDTSTLEIGPGDILEISVWQDETLNREVIVPPDQVISFPLAGEVNVKGMTIADLRRTLKQRLVEYVPNAVVTVMFRQVTSMLVYVVGKVNNPGVFPIHMNTTVMHVLAMAGGPNPFASTRNITILRNQDGKSIEIPFDYKDIQKGRNLEQNIVLQKGDVIIVP
jgi:polysaccharide export outer membrane protein